MSPETLGQVRSDDSLFAPLSDDVCFASVITHELAHAAMDAVPCPFQACVATTEYVAYAMQLRSLPDMLRTEVIRDASQVVVRDEINPMIALMAPDIFARKAWLHFSQRPDPCGYVDWIMQGDIVFDHELP